MARQKDNQNEERPFSYIKKPLAALGYPCMGLTLSAMLLGGAGMALSVRNQGNTPLAALAMCFCSLLLSVSALLYGRKALKEEEKNYILARIGIVVSGLLLIWWLVMILIGVKR